MRKLLTQCLLQCLLWASIGHATAEAENYLVGRGIADVTGPVVGLNLWGFGRTDQIGEGLHIRLRSRAFVVADRASPHNRLVFASVDVGSMDHHLVLGVIDKLQHRYGDTYGLHNVIISATHTHAGPTGYWHSRTETGFDGGFYPEHYAAIVQGITNSIVAAHEDLQPGSVRINSGRLPNAGANRSALAYEQNPAEERARYQDNTNTEMTVLRFSNASGDVGLVSWYALHPTAMNYYNRMVSGDHKGYASLTYERAAGTQYDGDNQFVAAFAQSDPGDVTPNTNLDNTGPGDSDVETTQIMGERQLAKARELFDSASEALQGPIDSRQTYVNLNHYAVTDQFTGQGVQYTCPSAYGYSFAGGSTEDGGANFLFYEGMTEQSWWRDVLIRLVTGSPSWTEAVRACQSPKAILFETGSQNPPLQSQIRTVSVARIGQLVILAMPAEVTTMSGRRLRDTVMAELGEWAQHIVLAGYANEFAGYVTTPEEYELQHYEAAHNLHGRWSLPAYQQVASQLAQSLEHRVALPEQPVYDDWRGKATELSLPIVEGAGSQAASELGAVVTGASQHYRAGDTVALEFRSTHPSAHFTTGNNFMTVEHLSDNGWEVVAEDTDWSTTVRWRFESGRGIATLSWKVPEDTPLGTYRLQHSGFAASGESFSGQSPAFEIVK